MAQQTDAQVIKRSIAYRAKYRLENSDSPTLRTTHPLMVVPHTRNRGGMAVTSLRTKELVGAIVRDACDVHEANSSAVAVEAPPQQHPHQRPDESKSFQAEFEARIATDLDMAKSGQGIVATLGSLSHSHFNCGCRNIICGKPGCECDTRGGGEVCTCAASPILDASGNYSLSKLQARDPSWHGLCLTGLTWEILSWKMDFEEPEAALVIAIALNKKNDAAMKTGGLEIWNTLVRLCKPEPHTGVTAFAPIRDTIIELCGSAVDSPHFLSMFRLVLDQGGADSPHLADLKEFTSAFVNPKIRKLRDETYSVIAPYPPQFPRVKNACIKWS